MSKVIVLLSGGIDSSVLTAHLKSNEDEVFGLIFNYGQPAFPREEEAAKSIANIYCHDFRVKNIAGLVAQDPGAVIWPFRNAILISLAVNWAVEVGADSVYLGATQGDYDAFPDCRPEFVALMHDAAQHTGVTVSAPFTTKSKASVVKLGESLGVPLGETWSCYSAERCGGCIACLTRGKALNKN
jgi:7-cyano-7-deazaguanine synthase